MKLTGLVLAAGLAGAAAAQAQDITLGVLTDMSGLYSDFSGRGSVVATQMAIDDFMAANPGVTVALVSADHQNKADLASTLARQWYDEGGVDAIFDVTSSAAALAVNALTREKNKVFLATNAASTALTGEECSPNMASGSS
jgi:branched-chain amino acid transport system substrate-binding protein